jgi:hypothetical protein
MHTYINTHAHPCMHKFCCHHITHSSENIKSLADDLWKWCVLLVLTLCIVELVWKCSWLFCHGPLFVWWIIFYKVVEVWLEPPIKMVLCWHSETSHILGQRQSPLHSADGYDAVLLGQGCCAPHGVVTDK